MVWLVIWFYSQIFYKGKTLKSQLLKKPWLKDFDFYEFWLTKYGIKTGWRSYARHFFSLWTTAQNHCVGLWCKHSNFQHPVDSGLSNLTTVGTLLEHLIWYMMTWCTSHFFYCCVTLLICLLMKVTRLKKTNGVYVLTHTPKKCFHDKANFSDLDFVISYAVSSLSRYF